MTRTLRLTIIPASKKNIIKQLQDDVYEIRLKAKPQRHQANDLLLQILAEYFDVPVTNLRIITGHHSHHKRVEIT